MGLRGAPSMSDDDRRVRGGRVRDRRVLIVPQAAIDSWLKRARLYDDEAERLILESKQPADGATITNADRRRQFRDGMAMAKAAGALWRRLARLGVEKGQPTPAAPTSLSDYRTRRA